MPWTLNKNGVTPRVPLTATEQLKLNTFMNAVRTGLAPNAAASSWDSNYKKLGGTVDQFEIRLSQGCRATFTVNNNAQVVTMLQVGGHT